MYALSRALVLLFKKQGGENTLKEGHGLGTDGWSNILVGGDASTHLAEIGKLKVRSFKGLFSELLCETGNHTTIHINTAGIDWGISYEVPEPGFVFTLDDVLARIPDLQPDLKELGIAENYMRVNELAYREASGFSCVVYGNNEEVLCAYKGNGFQCASKGNGFMITCTSEQLNNYVPQFLHKYVQKDFGTIPSLFLVAPFEDNVRLSEIAVVFLMSYYLGMLVRYYPTHWISLFQGDNGDGYWPVLNRAQNYVLQVFPELCMELISDRLERA